MIRGGLFESIEFGVLSIGWGKPRHRGIKARRPGNSSSGLRSRLIGYLVRVRVRNLNLYLVLNT